MRYLIEYYGTKEQPSETAILKVVNEVDLFKELDKSKTSGAKIAVSTLACIIDWS